MAKDKKASKNNKGNGTFKNIGRQNGKPSLLDKTSKLVNKTDEQSKTPMFIKKKLNDLQEESVNTSNKLYSKCKRIYNNSNDFQEFHENTAQEIPEYRKGARAVGKVIKGDIDGAKEEIKSVTKKENHWQILKREFNSDIKKIEESKTAKDLETAFQDTLKHLYTNFDYIINDIINDIDNMNEGILNNLDNQSLKDMYNTSKTMIEDTKKFSKEYQNTPIAGIANVGKLFDTLIDRLDKLSKKIDENLKGIRNTPNY